MCDDTCNQLYHGEWKTHVSWDPTGPRSYLKYLQDPFESITTYSVLSFQLWLWILEQQSLCRDLYYCVVNEWYYWSIASKNSIKNSDKDFLLLRRLIIALDRYEAPNTFSKFAIWSTRFQHRVLNVSRVQCVLYFGELFKLRRIDPSTWSQSILFQRRWINRMDWSCRGTDE